MIIIMYSYRNKNKERFRTQTHQESLHESLTQEHKPNTLLQSQKQSYLAHSRVGSQHSAAILNNLQKHVEYLQKKMHQTEVQSDNFGNSNQWLKMQLLEKETIIGKLTSRLQKQQQRCKDYQLKYENAKTDLSNYKLQQRVEVLNKQLCEQKEYDLRESSPNRGKKDKFSSAFVPSPFGSPKHFEERPSELITSMSRISLNDSTSSNNPFEGALWSQWKKMKNGKVKRQKELIAVNGKFQETRQQLVKEKKENQRLKFEFLRAEERHTIEMNKLKSRIGNYIKDQKMLKANLKQCEEKMAEFSHTLRDKGDGESEKFFANSGALQFQQIFEKISHNLDFESATIDITIQKGKKMEFWSQTEEHQEAESKVQELQRRVKEKEVEIQKQDRDWSAKLQQINANNLVQVKHASDMMDLYKCRIQHLNKVIEDGQKEGSVEAGGQAARQTRNSDAMCEIISVNEIQEYQQIMKRVRQLVELNDQQSIKISDLQNQNKEMQIRQEELLDKLMQERLILKQSKSSENDTENPNCAGCQKLKQKLAQRQIEKLDLTRKVEELANEKNHFFNSYQDKMNQYSHLEGETNKEIKKLRGDLIERTKSLDMLILETEDKAEENERLKEEIKDLKLDVEEKKSRIEVYETEPEKQINQQ